MNVMHETAYLRRPKRLLRVDLLRTYDHYPAARVMFRGRETIVGIKELASEADREADRLAKKVAKAKAQYGWYIAVYRPGMTSEQWAKEHGWVIGDWQIIRYLRRLGVLQP